MSARILVVEDNPANLELMTYVLKAFGHQTSVAMDGREAVEQLARERPDLILCDVHLPTMDGYEVVRRVKLDPALKSLPVVAVTALAMVGDREKVLAAGFDGYISKPIDPESFVSQVEAFLPTHSRSEQRHDSASSAFSPASTAPTGYTVLAVDNSLVNLQLLASLLEPSGYRVVTASSVREALELARSAAPDLILSDVHMPKEDGFDFIDRVKADPQLSAIPFVFISSTILLKSDQVEAFRRGALMFIERPIEPQMLLQELRDCLPPARARGDDGSHPDC